MRAVALALLGCVTVAACQSEDERGRLLGLADSYYEQKDYPKASQAIEDLRDGYADAALFPVSPNVLIHAGLAGDRGAYDDALRAVDEMDRSYVDYRYAVYRKVIPHLRRYGTKPVYGLPPDGDCAARRSSLDDMAGLALVQRVVTSDLEAAHWYGLYYTAHCSDPHGRAVLVATLAEMDLEAGRRLLAAQPAEDFAAIEAELCELRNAYTDYPESDLQRLERAGRFRCASPPREREPATVRYHGPDGTIEIHPERIGNKP
jgi:hypothetical protein